VEGKGVQEEHHTISPESGISSASPLSWQPDASPSAAAGGFADHQSPPLLNHVTESLSGWARSTSPSPSSSPTPAWEQEKAAPEAAGVDNDSGVASETSSVEARRSEKFNLGEIVNFVSASWDSVARDATVATATA